MDPALLQQYLPYRFLVAYLWHQGLPLWNQFSGLGMPLVADPQAFIFSPLDVFFTLLPSIHTWDLTLIFELLIGAVSTYFLAREFEFKAIGALTVALLFIFCPWVQWQLELLGRGICLTPFVFLFFVKMSKRTSFGRAALAGIAAAVAILSSHPEMAFISIMSAVLLFFVTGYYYSPSAFNFSSNFKAVAVAAAVAFGLTAPMLIPFAEYLLNGDSYKIAMVAASGLPIGSILSNYLFPYCAKGSLFLGPLSWFGLAAAICFFGKSTSSNRFAFPLIAGLCMSVIAVTRFEPFRTLFTIPPLSMTFATYCLPEYILFLCLVSGMGINALFLQANSRKTARQIATLTAVLIIMITPLILSLWHKNDLGLQFDSTFDLPRFLFKPWMFSAAFTMVMITALWITRKIVFRLSPFFLCMFIVLGITNLVAISSYSLPIRPSFQFPDPLPVKIDAEEESRVISIGDHLLKPGVNLIYRLASLQVLNPLLPRGYLKFIQACGGQVNQYTQTFPAFVGRLITLTGVHSILAMEPILDQTVASLSKKNVVSPAVDYDHKLMIDQIELLHDRNSGALFLISEIKLPEAEDGNYYLCFDIQDIRGKSVSYVEPKLISAGNREVVCSGWVPRKLQSWRVSLKVLRNTDCHFVSPTQVPFGSIEKDGAWLLGDNKTPLCTDINNDRFKISSTNNGIFVYKDKYALPRYFFVKDIIWVQQSEQALTLLKTNTDKLGQTAILEDSEKNAVQKCLLRSDVSGLKEIANFDTSGSVVKMESTRNLFPMVTLQTNVPKTALLVISNLYFPGWKIYLDNLPWQIFRVDYLLQGVLIPPGKHIIRFEYVPASFLIGVAFFVTTVTIMFVCYLRSLIHIKDNAIIVITKRAAPIPKLRG
jgi:hypothetical protein